MYKLIHSLSKNQFKLFCKSYAGGKKPWSKESYAKQSYADGKLEIVGFDMAGLVSLIYICKASFRLYLLKLNYLKKNTILQFNFIFCN